MRLMAVCCGIFLFGGCTSEPPIVSRPTPSVAEPSPSQRPRQERHPISYRKTPRPGEVVFYRLHPDWNKVDRYCGARDRSYIVRHVEIPPGAQDVLGRALRALFQNEWQLPLSQVRSVSIEEGMAIIDLRSMKDLGFAGTSCGGVGFMGSILRTAFQFESVDSVQLRLRGSCKRFGEYMQAGRCHTFKRNDLQRS